MDDEDHEDEDNDRLPRTTRTQESGTDTPRLPMAGPATERRAPTCSSASGSKATVGDGRTSKAAAPHDTDRKAADDAATEDEHDTDSDEGDGDAPPRTAAIFLDAPADSTTADCDGSEAAA